MLPKKKLYFVYNSVFLIINKITFSQCCALGKPILLMLQIKTILNFNVVHDSLSQQVEVPFCLVLEIW